VIGKIHRGSDFYDLVSYVCREEKKAQTVYGNFWEAISPESSVQSIAKKFSNQATLNRRVKKPVYHVSISPSYEEASQMDAIGWSEIAEQFVKKMNFEQNLVIGVVHNDTYFPNTNKLRPHLHLVVNTVNIKSNKCADTYYDYFLVENLLRDIEENLSIKREAQSKLEPDNRPDSLINGSGGEDKDRNSLEVEDKNKSLLPEIENLDKLADKIGTHEPDINGLDITAYTITSISSLAKIAALFVEKARSEKKDEAASQLAHIVDKAEELKKLPHYESLKLPPVCVDEISIRCLPQFIADAEQYVAEAIRFLPPGRSNEETQDENTVFDKFVNYFHSVDDLNGEPHKERYRVKGNKFGEVALVNSSETKKISIKVAEEIVYKSEFEHQDQQWLTPLDRLGEREKDLIDELPQSPEGVREKHVAACFVKQINNLFNQENTPTIACQSETETLKFDRLKLSDGMTQIRGFKAAENELVFNARISPNKAVSVSKNQISTEQLEGFIRSIKQNSPSRSHQRNKNKRTR